MRLVVIFLVLALLFAVPFLVWGGEFTAALSGQAAVAALARHGAWAGAAGIGLLVADLFLPIPATAVMAALGILYGPLLGGTYSALGSFLAGAVGYGAARLAGRRAAVFLAGERDLARGERFFERYGGWAVALARWLPILPEALACLAGLARMPARRFFPALACGSIPLGFACAALGAATGRAGEGGGGGSPMLAVVLAALLPLALWPLAQLLLRRSEPPKANDE